VVLRSRAVYQVALERGRSAEESSDRHAAREVAALWDYVAATMGLKIGGPEA
jgi:chromosome partitioning protein